MRAGTTFRAMERKKERQKEERGRGDNKSKEFAFGRRIGRRREMGWNGEKRVYRYCYYY